MHIGLNHPFIVAYGTCHEIDINRSIFIFFITDCTLEDTDNDKLAKVRYLYNVIKFKIH